MSAPLDLAAMPLAGFRAWLPEIVLAATFLTALPLSLLGSARRTWLPRGTTALGLATATLLAARGLGDDAAIGVSFRLDAVAALSRLVIDACALLLVLLSAADRRPRSAAGVLPVRAQPFVPLHALALGLLPQATSLSGAVAAVLGASLGASLLLGLCARSATASQAALRASLAAGAGAAFAVYGLSLRYPLTGAEALAVTGAPAAALGVTIAVTLAGLLVSATASADLWQVGRRRPDLGSVSALAGWLAGPPLLAVAALVGKLVPPPTMVGGAVLTAAAATTLTAGIIGLLPSHSAATRFAWAGASQAGYLLLTPVLSSAHGSAIVTRHLALLALGAVAAWGFRQLSAAAPSALTRLVSRLFLVGLSLLPPLLILSLRPAARPALLAVSALGLLGSLGYLRLALAREPVVEAE